MGIISKMIEATRGRRFDRLAKNSLGIVKGDNISKRVRRPELEVYDSYYENTQYDHLPEWDEAVKRDDYVQVRQRRPRLNYGFAKVLCQRIASKLVGDSTFPVLTIEDDPDTQEFIKFIFKASDFKARLLEPVRRMLSAGSVFVRYYLEGGAIKVEWYKSKYCYPKFAKGGELESIDIKYLYADEEDKDDKGSPKVKWYKLTLSADSDILFDNPVYEPGVEEPTFQVADQVDHGLGFVQGEWFRTSEDKHSPDGYSLIADILEFIDEMNYSLSQSSQSVSYNQEPQLVVNEMDEDELDGLIRSSMKAWLLGKNGKAQFLESNMNGVKSALELRDKIKIGISDIARIVFLDPEKMVASAQSGKAMEVMHGPMVDLVNELRPWVERGIKSITVKMAMTILLANKQGIEVPVTIPAGYTPKSLDLNAIWPPMFPMTMMDLKEKTGVALQLTGGNVYSREWAAGWLAKDFGVEDVEAEVAKVAAQPVINPFGGF